MADTFNTTTRDWSEAPDGMAIAQRSGVRFLRLRNGTRIAGHRIGSIVPLDTGWSKTFAVYGRAGTLLCECAEAELDAFLAEAAQVAPAEPGWRSGSFYCNGAYSTFAIEMHPILAWSVRLDDCLRPVLPVGPYGLPDEHCDYLLVAPDGRVWSTMGVSDGGPMEFGFLAEAEAETALRAEWQAPRVEYLGDADEDVGYANGNLASVRGSG